MSRWFASFAVFVSCLVLVVAAPAAEKTESAEARLGAAVRFLSSDELEGRGVGTAGVDKAADYLAEQFKQMGLKTKLVADGPFQMFKMTTGAELGEANTAKLVNGDKTIDLKLGDAYTPLSIGGSGKLDAPLVFAGYGITAKDLKYDDYEGLNVEGKAVIVMRHEPEQNNPHSGFNGTQHSQFAPFTRKVSNAFEHGAAAIIFVTDEYDIKQRIEQRRKLWQKPLDELLAAHEKFQKLERPTVAQIEEHRKLLEGTVNEKFVKELADQGKKLAAEYDPIMNFKAAGGGDGSRMPVLFVRRATIAELIKSSTGKELAALEREIDVGPKPQSRELTGWRLVADVNVRRTEADVKNVIAVLEGSGPKADETIVVGAHYDHLGLGGEGSFVPDRKEVHNGADDNASGTAALLDVAHRLAARDKPLPRRVVFIAFTGEERGLIGSAKYCNQPLYPLDKTVAMLNMDMVGRLTDDKLIVQGCDTAPEFAPVIDRLNERFGFKLTKQAGGSGPSDHSSFYAKKIPVLHFFTGLHSDYHKPSDDFDKVNVGGMRRVAEMVTHTVVAIADAPDRPTFTEAKESKPAGGGGGGDRPYFGSIPDFAQDEPGYKLSGVTKGGPAEKAGIKAGDILIKVGESRVGNLEDFDSALRKFKGGDKVTVIVKRAGAEVPLVVTLDPPR